MPIEPVVRTNFGGELLELALAGGEDYELLFTASAEVIDRVKRAASCPVTVIGEIVAGRAGEITLVDRTGKPIKLRRGGWVHFTK